MRCENLSDAKILEGIRHPSDNVGKTDIHTVEGCILADNNYRWYYGIGQVFRPHLIVEIGVRYGYSLYALAKGAETNPAIVGFDNESYCPGSVQWAQDRLGKVTDRTIRMVAANTQELNNLAGLVGESVSIFSVDGDHTAAGARHDIDLAWPCLRRGGLLLVDDIDYAGQDGKIHLRPVVEKFCTGHGVDFLYLPTTRGLAVIVRP